MGAYATLDVSHANLDVVLMFFIVSYLTQKYDDTKEDEGYKWRITAGTCYCKTSGV